MIRTGEKSRRLAELERVNHERWAEMITDYWYRRGHSVSVTVEQTEFNQMQRCKGSQIKSDMINGLPREAAERKVRGL